MFFSILGPAKSFFEIIFTRLLKQNQVSLFNSHALENMARIRG